MSEPIKHHYLPQSYQKLFWNDQKKLIFIFDIKNKAIENTRNPKNVFFEKHLYTADIDNPIEENSKKYSRTTLENPILSNLDGIFFDAIRAIEFNKTDSVDKITISIFLGYLTYRTPSSMEFINGINNDAVNNYLKNSIDEFNIDEFTVSTGKNLELSTLISAAHSEAKRIINSKWTIIQARNSKFITSDRGRARLEDDILLFPLSSNYCLEISQVGLKSSLEFKTANNLEVLEINQAIAYCADSKILGADEEHLKHAITTIYDDSENSEV